MGKYYKEELSKIHDSYFGDLALNAAFELLNYLKNTKHTGKDIVDMGCGSGIFASILSEENYNVIGVDISPEILEIAKLRAPKATFITTSLFDYELPKTDIVTSIGEPVNYLFDNKSSYSEAEKLFTKIFNCLRTNGVFMFDFLTNKINLENKPRIIEKENMTMFLDISVDLDAWILTRKMTFFTKSNDHYIKDSEIHKQFLFDEALIIEKLQSLNFEVRKLDNYNGVNFRQGHIGLMCTKK